MRRTQRGRDARPALSKRQKKEAIVTTHHSEFGHRRRGEDRRSRTTAPRDLAHDFAPTLPETGWRRALALWGRTGTPPFFAAFRDGSER